MHSDHEGAFSECPKKVRAALRLLKPERDANPRFKERALVKSGYASLTTNHIADEAGVNIASLYQYFPNKQAIFVELCRRHVEQVRKLGATILGSTCRRSKRTQTRGSPNAERGG